LPTDGTISTVDVRYARYARSESAMNGAFIHLRCTKAPFIAGSDVRDFAGVLEQVVRVSVAPSV
jgi:hypothetical protein